MGQVNGKTVGTGIAHYLELIRISREGAAMTKEKWLLLGAVLVGLIVVLYVVFLCPSDCH